jgi:hypothetical protein
MTTSPGGHGYGSDVPEGGRPHPQERQERPEQQARPWPYAAHLVPGRAPYPDRDRRAHVAPLVATVFGVPLMLVDGLIVMFSPMATDSCSAGGCHALYTALTIGPCLLAAAVLALIGAWQIPHRLRHRLLRTALSAAAPLLALSALLLYLHLPAAS